MVNEWIVFDEYPNYAINESGQIRNNKTGRILKRIRLQNGAPAVGLFNKEGRQVFRQVSTFMGMTWMDPPPYPAFDTPMHLDGDRDNCHKTNLIFRPRWFVIQYHRECLNDHYPLWSRPFRIVETGDIFKTPFECSRCYGVLQKDVVAALVSKAPLFPGALTVEDV